MKVTGKSRHQAVDWEQTSTIIRVTADDGSVWEIRSGRPGSGGLEVRALGTGTGDDQLAVLPQVANTVVLKAVVP